MVCPTRLIFYSVLGAALAAGIGTAQERPEQEGRDIEQKRQEWFYRQRAYPHRYVPAGAHARAVAQWRTKMAAMAGKKLASASWTQIGPQPINTPFSGTVVSGRISAIAVDPANSNHVYAGAAQGGVWQTVDGGATWSPLTDSQPSLAIGSIALDPSNSNIIYVGTGEENFGGDSYYGAGILKSVDGGATWSHYCGPFCGLVGQDGYYGGGARIGGLAVQPSNNQVLLAAVALLFQDGIYRSADGGVTWTQVLAGNPGTAVMFDPNTPNVAYAALGSSFSGGAEGVYRSTDGGQTWRPINGSGAGALPLANAGRIVLTMVPSRTTTLYASIANVADGSLAGLFRSTNSGGSWAQLASTPDFCTPQCSYDNAVAVSPINPGIVFAGGAFTTTLIRTTNGGAGWSTLQSAQTGSAVHADVHVLAFSADGTKLYIGCDGGMYVATQITAPAPVFKHLNSTLAITQFYPGISTLPGSTSTAIAGNQDNGTVAYTGSPAWNQVTCGDGGYAAIDFVNPNNVYAACQEIFIQKSTGGVASTNWTLVQNGIDTTDRAGFIPPLVMDPSNSTALYFGTYRVYQTTNGANSWTAISPDLTGGPGFFGNIATLAVAPADPNTVYAGTADTHLQVTSNAGAGSGATWNDRSAGLPPRVITYVAVDPTVATTAYVAFSGFTGFGDTLGHVFRSTDSGQTWADISGDLPNTPVNCLAVHPSNPNALFAGTDVGVFYTTDGGTTWNPPASGMPAVAVFGLSLDKATNTLWAVTHGRSAWTLNLAGLVGVPAVSLSPATLTFANQVIGTTSAAKPVTLTNTGGAALTIFGITASGDFAQTDTCGTSVAPGANCAINVTFKPTAKGPRTGSISIRDDAAGSPHTISVSGTGTVAGLAPAALKFGAVAVGQTSAPKTVKLTNYGKTALSISAVTIAGTNSGDFVQTNTCGTSVGAGLSCTLSVTFKPSATGARSAVLAVSDNGGGSPQKVSLSGAGS